jgi:DNA-binding CsgD family transcriptional regulator
VIHYDQRTAHIQRGLDGRTGDERDASPDTLAPDGQPLMQPLDGLAGVLAAALDDLPGGIIVLDADRRVLQMNRAARAIVARQDGISVRRSGAIVLASPEAARQLAAVLDGTLNGTVAGGMVRVPRRQGRAAYTLLVAVPTHRPERRDGGVVLLIHDPERLLQASPAMLRRVLGLTRREAELVEALVGGIGTTGFAVQAGISLNTVRFHLKSIYAKVGVRGQADLLRTVLTTVAVLGGERHAPLWRDTRARRIRKHP